MGGGEAITGADVLFFLAVIGAIGGFWWRVESAIKAARQESVTRAEAAIALAQMSQRELAEHKLHVAETYTTKHGVRETILPLAESIDGMNSRLDKINERLDRVIEGKAARTNHRSRMNE